ncbi:MAG: AbrB/MazE/SpoVT family DNA-binding domain-containing protein [Saccharopolyspora sp.]|uniref:AbrB/MazE/SpoVT family DNA-binding domain-containing protein n=1 Tax=Saccharopolyspora sp. TaxID=33915 RepID=UPI0025E5C0AD|nr:AbrB/MazE/SpoVT family DNA-binding domain-containing protein [Saccharopolyspora sp.]MBQ6641123.1 AbrB/MazE/SpoVT family DNA-binding domain-containing protein [Saccharopolyspora sp.]
MIAHMHNGGQLVHDMSFRDIYSEGMTSAAVKMNPQGRVSIPAPFRHELGLTPDTDLVSYVEDGRVVFEEREHLMRRIQQTALNSRATAGSPVDELLADRRAAAARETAETES